MSDRFIISDQSFDSRLIMGSAGYPNQQVMLDALAASGAELVTASVRRISLEGYAESLVDLLGEQYRMLPNTSGCTTSREAVLTAQLARPIVPTTQILLARLNAYYVGLNPAGQPALFQMDLSAGTPVAGGGVPFQLVAWGPDPSLVPLFGRKDNGDNRGDDRRL